MMVRFRRFSRNRNTRAGRTVAIVPGARQITSRKLKRDHEEGGDDAGDATIRHD
jgi:hypothetical protein